MVNVFRRRRGFSLIEALVALSLIGFASSTLLLATSSAVQSGNDATARTIARGIAEQLADEIVGQPYCEVGASATGTMGPEPGETSSPLRRLYFDDSDDYSGYASSPPCDGWGIALGSDDGSGNTRPAAMRLPDDYFADWEVRITFTYLDPDDPTRDLAANASSVVRAVRIQITRDWGGESQELALLRRVLAYVPPL